MAGVTPERVEFTLESHTCTAKLFLADKPIMEVTAARLTSPWASGTEGIFAALVILAEHLYVEAQKLGLPVQLDGPPEAKA